MKPCRPHHYRGGIGQAVVCCCITDDPDQADIDDAGIKENGQTMTLTERSFRKLLTMSNLRISFPAVCFEERN